MNWFHRKNKPVTRGGIGILIPVILLPLLFSLTLYQLRQIPGRPFHLPAIWETAIAMVLGLIFGTMMLVHTAYEKREDGLVYSKPNKNFKYILIGIIVIRIVLSEYFRSLDATVFTILAMVLAIACLYVWRIGSYMKYKATSKNDASPIEEPEITAQ